VQDFSPIVTSVSCVSDNVCMAVGSANDSINSVVFTTTNGVNWSETVVTDLTSYYGFEWVHCVSASTCWAVSAYGYLAATTDGGSTWSTVDLPSHDGDEDIPVSNLSCPSTTECFVGVVYSVYHHAAVDELVSGTWTTTGDLVGTGGYDPSPLAAISCPSTSVCVGVSGIDYGQEVEYTSDGGSTWNETGGPLTGGAGDVSCPSTSYCEAIDGSDDEWQTMYSTSSPLGSSWTSDTPSSDPDGRPSAVSCAAADDCEVVGSWDPHGTSDPEYYAESGGGSPTSWTMQLSDPPAAEQAIPPENTPSSVACLPNASSSTCYVPTTGGVLRSSDGGSTWVSVVNTVEDRSTPPVVGT
jgi:hypothetical protein